MKHSRRLSVHCFLAGIPNEKDVILCHFVKEVLP